MFINVGEGMSELLHWVAAKHDTNVFTNLKKVR